MGTDGGLYELFKKNLPGHWVRVESGWTSAGVPDAEYCMGGRSGWVEFKEERGGRVTVRTLQASFAIRRTLEGGMATLAVRVKDGVAVYQGSVMRQMLHDPGSRDVVGGRSCPLAAAGPPILSVPARPGPEWSRLAQFLQGLW